MTKYDFKPELLFLRERVKGFRNSEIFGLDQQCIEGFLSFAICVEAEGHTRLIIAL